MFRWRHNPPGTDETVDVTGWLDAAPETIWSRIIGGSMLPILLLAGGIYCIATQHGVLIGRGVHHLKGASAIGLGIACIGAAMFFHSHYFWGPLHRILIVSELGRIVGASAFIIGFFFMLWAMFWM